MRFFGCRQEERLPFSITIKRSENRIMKMIEVGGMAQNLQGDLARLQGLPIRKEKLAVRRMAKRETIPVFFASDNNYLPFLDVAISSLVKNRSRKYDYALHILHSGIDGEKAEMLMRHAKGGVSIRFINVESHVNKLADCFNLRDYYTPAIYYRLFIVGMFPQYKKAVYLDCDTVVLGDVSELYRENLGQNLIGAVADGVVQGVPVFKKYTKDALGVDGEKYFNSGVIVMNLDGMRKMGFYDAFCSTLRQYRFRVAPDQDCLNVLCKGRVHYFPEAWNRMPQGGDSVGEAKLIHYNLAQKPWHYDGIRYEDYFWAQAKESPFYDEIVGHKQSFTAEMAKKDEESGKALLALAEQEAKRKDCYVRTARK